MSKRKKWLIKFNLETGKVVIKEFHGGTIFLSDDWIYSVFECVNPERSKAIKAWLDTLKEQREFFNNH